MNKIQNLGDFEQVMILAMLRLRAKGAYGVSIREEIIEQTERRPSPGAIYTTLERLESKGLINSSIGEATPERGGRAKRYYHVTNDGLKALQKVQRDYNNLLNGLDIFGDLYA